MDWHTYKERHLVECFFQKLKWFRRGFTRYDKLDASFLAFVYIAAIVILLHTVSFFKQGLKALIQKGGKGYRIKHAQIPLKLDKRSENEEWTYNQVKEAYGASHSTIAGAAKRYVMEGLEAVLGRNEQKNGTVR